jgi:hypothetical protein
MNDEKYFCFVLGRGFACYDWVDSQITFSKRPAGGSEATKEDWRKVLRDHFAEENFEFVMSDSTAAQMRMELSGLDELLARRPALDQATRYEKVAHAIKVASRVDELESKLTAISKSVLLTPGETEGTQIIALERRRQITEEKWTAEHDDQHRHGELALAAGAYVTQALYGVYQAEPPHTWPWAKEWWKPSPNAIRNITKAGALVVAELDRLLRHADGSNGTPGNNEPGPTPQGNSQSPMTDFATARARIGGIKGHEGDCKFL